MRKLLLTALFSISLIPFAFGALPSDTVWEVRPANGDNLNGACVDASVVAGTTDYSQQNAAQLSLTDLATSGTTVTTLTSATGGFTAQMVGNCIRINAGTNATVGYYMITGYTDTNTVTLDRAPDDGVGGVSSGEGKVGGATASVDSQTTTTLADSIVAGNHVYIKNEGSWAENITTAIGGSLASPITWEGYGTTRGDNTRAILDLNSGAGVAWTNSAGNYQNYINLEIREAGSHGFAISVSYAGGFIFKNVNLTNNGGDGFYTVNRRVETMFYDSESANNSSEGYYNYQANREGDCKFYGSEIHDNSADGIYGCYITGSMTLAYDNAGDGAVSQWSESAQINSWTFEGNTGDGLDIDKDMQGYVFSSIFSNNGGYGLNVSDGDYTGAFGTETFDYNAFYNNTSGARNNIGAGDNDITTDPTYTNAAGDDYSVGTNMKAKGFPSAFPSGNTTSYVDIGAVQRQEPAGGSGSSEHSYVSVG